MYDPLLQQIKKRRLQLGFKQNKVSERTGMSRQQYQHLESKGNPRLDTLELIAKGLNSELLLIPVDKMGKVLSILQSDIPIPTQKIDYSLDPWQGLLGDEE